MDEAPMDEAPMDEAPMDEAAMDGTATDPAATDPAALDTSRARRNILARIRKARGAQTAGDAAAAGGAPSAGLAGASGPAGAPVGAPASADAAALRPRVGDDPVAHFEAQAQRMSSTTARVATLAEVPAALAGWLRDYGLPLQGVCWETLAGLDWAGAGLAMEARAPRDGDRLGVTGAFAAIAETGTLMLLSGPRTPASTHLLPETHVAVVAASRVLRHYEDGFARMREELGAPPRAMNLVSGPSRTGDIEQTIVLGAHGPYRVHLILVEGE